MRFILFLCCLSILSCKSVKELPQKPFSLETLPSAPDYSVEKYWAALPSKADAADLYPKNFKDKVVDPAPKVDLFYIYPTIHEDSPNWNADVNDVALNKKIQALPIRNQATVFNGLTNIYAPYYRQMHLHGYFGKGGEVAFDTAYADVLRAFRYYIQHYNTAGRPIIIAAHSQGTNHAERLIREEILPNSTLRAQLKLAYLVGMPIKADMENFPPCTAEDDIDCFLSWRTYGKEFVPKVCGDSICATHPITFQNNLPINEFKAHHGILYKNFKLTFKKTVQVETKSGFVRVVGIKNTMLKLFFNWENYHVADYNLFWLDIRENFEQRLAKILDSK